MKINRNQEKSLEINENTWKSMKIYKNVCPTDQPSGQCKMDAAPLGYEECEGKMIVTTCIAVSNLNPYTCQSLDNNMKAWGP